GVVYTHPALLQSYRGVLGQTVQHDYNWYDPAPKNPFPEPKDLVGHGTHTMGTLAGGRAANGLQIGMAPDVRWMAARGCASTFCADETLIASAQWMLAPTDATFANPRPDLRPHIISNSWGASGESNWFTGFVEAWNAAGIFSTFAVGNSGGLFGCGSSSSPGNYAASLAVGATDAEDFIAPFSSRGPTSDGRTKPDLSAPGVAIPSAWLNNDEVSLSGTSMATPHVAGAAALLWSANPALIGDIAATRALLTGTALRRTGSECDADFNAVPNNTYGWGRLDVYAAVQAARVNVPWLSVPASVTLPANGTYTLEVTLDARQVAQPGPYEARILQVRGNTLLPIPVALTVTPAANTARLSGQLRDRWTGTAVYGRISIGQGPSIETDAAGAFTATLPTGSYPLAASAYDYVPATLTTNLLTDTTQLITLTADAPHVQVLAPTLSATLPFGARTDVPVQVRNLGPQPLSVSVSVPPLEWSVNAAPSAALYDLSGFPALPLADDMIYTDALSLPFTLPVYGTLYDQIYLSSNGWVSVQPASNALPQAVCSTSTQLPLGTLAGLWTDLDPAQGGAVRAGALDADTFVVSWEAVPPWRETPDSGGPTFTFQIILRSDGSVEYRYGQIGTLPWPWSVGVFGGEGGATNRAAQILACMRGSDVQALTNTGWELQNQPLPSLWLSGAPEMLTVAPNGLATLTATLRGIGYVPWRAEPFAATLRLTSNDPLQPITDIAAQVSAGPPAAQVWLPMIGR
ncbi:MAG: S8 family serine peptidase, partial [Anaerolineales bacterium]